MEAPERGSQWESKTQHTYLKPLLAFKQTMPLHSQTSDTVLKRLTSLFRALPSASMPDLQASHASPMPNSEPRDHGDGDNDEGHQDQEQEDGQQKRVSQQLSGELRSSKPSDDAEQPSSELRSSKPSDEAESRQSNLETLVKPSSNEPVVVADQSAGKLQLRRARFSSEFGLFLFLSFLFLISACQGSELCGWCRRFAGRLYCGDGWQS